MPSRWQGNGGGLLARTGLVLLWLGCQGAPTSEGPPPVAPTAAQQQARVQEGLAQLISSLMDEGRYACCVSAPCRWCALQTAGCACGPGLQRGEPVCEECALMWTKGLGSVEGVDPDGVRSFLEAMREDPWCGRGEPSAP